MERPTSFSRRRKKKANSVFVPLRRSSYFYCLFSITTVSQRLVTGRERSAECGISFHSGFDRDGQPRGKTAISRVRQSVVHLIMCSRRVSHEEEAEVVGSLITLIISSRVHWRDYGGGAWPVQVGLRLMTSRRQVTHSWTFPLAELIAFHLFLLLLQAFLHTRSPH